MAFSGSETLAARAAFFFTGASCLAWTTAMCTSQWVTKKNMYYRLQGGLFEINLQKGYIGSFSAQLLDPVTFGSMSWLNALLEKRFKLDEFREHMCALPRVPRISDQACRVAQHLQLSSWGLILCVLLSFVALAAATGLMHRYVYVKPRAVLRKWMHFAYAIAPMLQIGGLAQYIWAAYQIIDMFPRMDGAHLGESIVFGAASSFLSLCALFVVVVLLGKSLEEEFNETVSEQKKLMRQDPELYGAAAAALPAPLAADAPGQDAMKAGAAAGTTHNGDAYGGNAYSGNAYGGDAYSGGGGYAGQSPGQAFGIGAATHGGFQYDQAAGQPGYAAADAIGVGGAYGGDVYGGGAYGGNEQSGFQYDPAAGQPGYAAVPPGSLEGRGESL